jgi:ankyrin repeat protein
VDNGVKTPLHWAMDKANNKNIVKLLLDSNANPNVKNNKNKTPLDNALSDDIKVLLRAKMGS